MPCQLWLSGDNDREGNVVACGRVIFEVGQTKEAFDFNTIAELRELEDDLTWKHWPEELRCVSIEYTPAKVALLKAAE